LLLCSEPGILLPGSFYLKFILPKLSMQAGKSCLLSDILQCIRSGGNTLMYGEISLLVQKTLANHVYK